MQGVLPHGPVQIAAGGDLNHKMAVSTHNLASDDDDTRLPSGA